MTIPYNIPIEIPVNKEAPVITIAELKEKIQSYVNSLFVQVNTTQESLNNDVTHPTLTQHLHSLAKNATVREQKDIDFISHLHAEGGRAVPADEDPMYALFEAKLK